MARVLTPRDAHALMNLLVKEATGQDAEIQVVDSSTFVSAGETVLATGIENTLNALSIVLGRTFMAVRPYKAKLNVVNAINTGEFTSRMRKISFYSREAQASGDWNTQLFTNLEDGYDNGSNPNVGGQAQSTASMWVQNQPVPLEMNFSGQSVWQDSTTIYENQLKVAFRDESEFIQFASGIMTEKGNDIESQKEAYNRMNMLNFMAGLYSLGQNTDRVVNLTAEFNAANSTAYTSKELREEHLTEFLEFFVTKFKNVSNYMRERSVNYHWSPAKEGYVLLRHTDNTRQKAVMFEPFFTAAEAKVKPEIFNPEYLDIKNFESVSYWQNNATEANRPAIKVKPAIPNVNNPAEQTVGEEVNIPYVLGMIWDADALMTDFQFEDALTTPVEARKRYRNIWWTFSKNAINDFTENAVLFIMQDN